jgi:hypothetical protein
MMATAKAPTVASHRLELTSLDEFLDRVMSGVSRRRVDLETEAGRTTFRTWLRRQCAILIQQVRWDVVKGAERGIDQVLALVDDPDYYVTRQERRREGARRRRERDARQRQEWEAERAAQEAETRELIRSGKLAPISRWRVREVPAQPGSS